MFNIRVFIDTSALPGNISRPGAGFTRLIQLVKYGVVQVYLSDIVIKEWRSQRIDEYRELHSKAQSSFSRWLRHPWSNDLLKADIAQPVIEAMSTIEKDITFIAAENSNRFLKDLEVEVVAVEPLHGEKVIEAYFEGVLPFRRIKSREDFPDAFIFQAALELISNSEEPLYCIVSDRILQSTFGGKQNFVTFDKISDFVKSEIILTAVRKIVPEQAWQEMLEQIKPRLSELTEQVAQWIIDREPYLNDIHYAEISHFALPSDNNDAQIEGVYRAENILIEWSNAVDFGLGLISVPVSFECKADLVFDVFRGEAFLVPEAVWVDLEDPETHQYFDGGATVRINVRALLAIEFGWEEQEGDKLPEIIDVNVEEMIDISIMEDVQGNIFV